MGVVSIFLTFLIRPRRFPESRQRSLCRGPKVAGIDTANSGVGPRYVPVLSGFFSEGMVFSGFSASLSVPKSFA
jgi:hypothetical protein